MANAEVTVHLDVANLDDVKYAIATLQKERDDARAELKRARDYARSLFDDTIQDGTEYGELLQIADEAVSLLERARTLRLGLQRREFDRQAEDFMRRHGTALAAEAAKARRELAELTEPIEQDGA